MGETFHSLLRLDWSFLDRGRDARQSVLSERPALADESKPPTTPDNRNNRRARTASTGVESTELESEINERSDKAGGNVGAGGNLQDGSRTSTVRGWDGWRK